MLKKIISAVIAITLVIGMCSCSEQESTQLPWNPADPEITRPHLPEPEEPVLPPDDTSVQPTANYTFTPGKKDEKITDEFAQAFNNFSVELFKQSVKQDLKQGRNTLVSPESVSFALGMTANGANNNTLVQMKNVLCGTMSLADYNKNMNLLISDAHNSNSENSKLEIANSVWLKDMKGLTLKESFVKTCKEQFNAEMFKAPFDKSTVESINGWVNEKTHNMIPRIVETLDANARAVLVNCVAFDSKWAVPYDEDQIKENCEFTNANGEKTNCTMLSSKEKFYVEGEHETGFVKEYSGGKYVFMAVLPNEGTGIYEYVSSLTADRFAKLYKERTGRYDVKTKTPQFKYDYDINLNETLRGMGMEEAFTMNADFSNMTGDKSLYIGSVLHKTHIELDANGTKAAAATAVTMDAKCALDESLPKTVYLDRPFVYAIMDTRTGLPVFMGTVCDPSVQ